LVKLWDTQNGQLIRTFVSNLQTPSFCFTYSIFRKAGHDNWIRALVFHPNGKYILSASDDNSIRIWDLKTARCYRTVDKPHGHFVTCLAWGRQRQGNAAAENGSKSNGAHASTDAQKVVYVVATGSVDQSIKIWMPNSRSR
jgi:platelet-activating factor acetylhydrolase IB subunit alpha